MSDIDTIIKDVEAKLAKATPGKLEALPGRKSNEIDLCGNRTATRGEPDTITVVATITKATNGEHIAAENAAALVATHNAAPALIAEVKRLREADNLIPGKAVPSTSPRPRVVCLCGSTRFYDAFQRANYEETMKGHIVLSVGFYPHSQTAAHGEEVGCTPEQKLALDVLHLRKIDLADEVFVLNVGGYIGSSTRGEMAYATMTGKPIRYLEPSAAASIAKGGGGGQ